GAVETAIEEEGKSVRQPRGDFSGRKEDSAGMLLLLKKARLEGVGGCCDMEGRRGGRDGSGIRQWGGEGRSRLRQETTTTQQRRGGDGSGAKAGSGCGSNAVKGRRMGYSLRLRDEKKKKGAAVKQRRQRGRVAGSGQRRVVVARVEKG
ncbi:hypothetical protein GW17_00054713, partial [Ensete ventricosum]